MDFDPSPYAERLAAARAAFRTDPSYAIAVARAGGVLVGRRAERQGLTIPEYLELQRKRQQA